MENQSPNKNPAQEPKIITIADKIDRSIPNAKALKYITLGALIPVIGYFIASLEIAYYVLGFLFALAIVFYAGVVWGQNLLNKKLEKLQNNWEEDLKTVQNSSKNLATQLLDLRKNPPKDAQTAVNKVAETLQPFSPVVKKGLVLGAAFVTRIWAFSSLMGVLAFAVSLAVCIATFMQVQLLDKQNAKLDIQNDLLKEQDSLLVEQNDKLEAQNRRLNQQTYLQEADRRSSLFFLFSDIMDVIDKELKADYGEDSIRNLSPQLIGRIVALSTKLKPYNYLSGDTLIKKPLSPERGQLLVNLVESQLDSVTYKLIFEKAKFDNADLEDANLRGVYLRGAYLSEANLRGANLVGTNLRGANLVGTNLKEAYLEDANLRGTNLRGANLRGANLRSTNLRGANLVGTNLREAYLVGTNLRGANLRGANLREVYLSETNLRGANLRNIKTSDTLFFITLAKQNVEGIQNLKKHYYVDPTPQYDIWNREKEDPYYLIKRKEN